MTHPRFRHHSHLLASTAMLCFIAAEGQETPAGGGPKEEEEAPPVDPALGVVGEALPEGFKDWEDFNQRKGVLPGAEETDTAAGAEGEDSIAAQEETPEQAAARVKEVVDFTTEGMTDEMKGKVSPFVETYAKTGTLSDEEVAKAAEAVGLSKEFVLQFMDGAKYRQQEASNQATAFVKPFHDTFGGAEEFAKFQTWSAEKDAGGKLLNISAEDDAAYQEALKNNSPKAALALLKQMKTAYEAAGKGPPARDLTAGAQSSGADQVQGYATQAEMEADMNDPKYRSDAAFRASVSAKLAKSNF